MASFDRFVLKVNWCSGYNIIVDDKSSFDEEKVEAAKAAALAMPGIQYVRVWLNEGELAVGDDIMFVLVGGDIRPHVIDALQALVGEIKSKCVTETEVC